MPLRNGEFRRQNTKPPSRGRHDSGQKDKGQAEWVTGLFFVLMTGVLMCSRIQLASWSATSDYLEDALAASNLASALIDVEEYGRSHRVLIRDPSAAFDIYREAVRENLGLNEAWESSNFGLISGPVEIVDYVIYNVDGNRVEAVRMDTDGCPLERWSGERGEVLAPNGRTVEYTGVYSEIRFTVEGFPGVTVDAHKGKLVDIVSENEQDS